MCPQLYIQKMDISVLSKSQPEPLYNPSLLCLLQPVHTQLLIYFLTLSISLSIVILDIMETFSMYSFHLTYLVGNYYLSSIPTVATSTVHPFLWLSNTPLRRHAMVCLAICLSMDVWFVFSFSQLK